ncbi:excinuclease ABC subunit C [Bacillus cereus group sp. N11]|nr:excinuclease ABC subunit C [Bacillus cereus group sp. N11]PHD48814.1 excinuclease ABC subunit C [Bacillus toyonensis]HDR7689138.1 excinuclease ABC subunit C [Bacillus toyonensis]
MFNYNFNDELLFVGKARKVKQRIKNHRNEVYRIDVCIVEDLMEREIHEIYMINEFQANYNVDKVFYK